MKQLSKQIVKPVWTCEHCGLKAFQETRNGYVLRSFEKGKLPPCERHEKPCMKCGATVVYLNSPVGLHTLNADATPHYGCRAVKP